MFDSFAIVTNYNLWAKWKKSLDAHSSRFRCSNNDKSFWTRHCLDCDLELTLLAAAGTDETEALDGGGLRWLTLRARGTVAVVSWRTRAATGREVDRGVDEAAGFLVAGGGASVTELPLLGVLWRSSDSQTGTVLVMTVRTVVAVAVEPSLDEEESSASTARLPRPRSTAESLHVFTVDAATISANVSIADADDGLSGSDCSTSNSFCAVMISSALASSCACSVQN